MAVERMVVVVRTVAVAAAAATVVVAKGAVVEPTVEPDTLEAAVLMDWGLSAKEPKEVVVVGAAVAGAVVEVVAAF